MSRIVLTKLLPPKISGELIDRPRLLELFSNNPGVKLVAFVAPAGYGKTIAALQYVNALPCPSVWYQLNAYDNDPAVFIQSLIMGIRRHYTAFGAEALQLVAQSGITSFRHSIAASIANELADNPDLHLSLVLDDYHEIAAPAIHGFVQEFLEYLPDGSRIVITSRSSPPLALPRLRVAGEVELVQADTLRFSVAEVGELLSRIQPDASPLTIETLAARTGGWPAALRLMAASALADNPASPVLASTSIYDYLAEEVLDQLPPETRDFLIAASVLEILTPQACDLLLQRNDSRQTLGFLEQQRLFLIPLAGPDIAYRFHQLFREFLLERLGPGRDPLFRRAGRIALENGDWDNAVEYRLSAGDDPDLLPLLIKAGREAFRQGRWQTVERWLEKLGRERLSADAWLSLFQAKIHVRRGRLDEAGAWIERGLPGFECHRDVVGVAECRFIQAKILNSHGRYGESLVLLAEAFPVLQQAEPSLRFDLSMEKALLFIRMGQLRQAEELLLKGLQVAQKGDDSWITAHFFEGLGNTYYMLGEFHKALDYYTKATRSSPSGVMPGYCPDFLGFIYQEMGQIDRAMAYLQDSIALKERTGLNEALLPAYFQLSGLYADLGEFEKAEGIYDKAVALIAEIGGERFFQLLLQVDLGRIRTMQGRLDEARNVMEEALAETDESGVALLMCRLFYGAILLMNGEFAAAEETLLRALGSGIEFAQALTQCYFLLASLKFATGDMDGAAAYSRKLLNFSADKSFEQMYVYMFENAHPILRYGLESGIEVPFIQRVLVLLGEQALSLLSELAAHPDYSVRASVVFPITQIAANSARDILRSLAIDPDPRIRRSVRECAPPDAVESNGIPISAECPHPPLVTPIAQRTLLGAAPTVEQQPPLWLEMLGPDRIVLSGADITGVKWRFTKSRDLLLYLAHQGKPVGINRILEDLWPDTPLEKAINLFYGALHWLRKVLRTDSHPELVSYAAKTCQLLPGACVTDRDRFIALIDPVIHAKRISPSDKARLEEAAALFRGEYLERTEYPWVVLEREHLNRLYLETAIHLARFYLQERDFLRTVNLLEPLSRQYPLREEITAFLMSAYAGLGDRRAVIRRYQQLKTDLDEELGVTPAPEIKRLYYELCGQREENPGAEEDQG